MADDHHKTMDWLVSNGFHPDIAQVVAKKFETTKKLTTAKTVVIKLLFRNRTIKKICKTKSKVREVQNQLLELIQASKPQIKKPKKPSVTSAKNKLTVYLTRYDVTGQIATVLIDTFENLQMFQNSQIRDIQACIQNALGKDSVDQELLDKIENAMQQHLSPNKTSTSESETNSVNSKYSKFVESANSNEDIRNHQKAAKDKIARDIQLTQSYLERLCAESADDHVNYARLCRELGLPQMSPPLSANLRLEATKKNLELRIDSLLADLKTHNQSLSDFQRMSKCLETSRASLFRAEKNRLRQQSNMNQLLESACLQESLSPNESSRRLWFRSKPDVESLARCLLKYGLQYETFDDGVSEYCGLRVEGFDHPKAVDLQELLNTCTGTEKFHFVEVVFDQQISCQFRVDSLELCESSVDQLTELYRLADSKKSDVLEPEASHKQVGLDSLSEFDEKLIKIENKYGGLINLGRFAMGGLLLTVGHVENAGQWSHFDLLKGVTLKMDQQRNHWFVDPVNDAPHSTRPAQTQNNTSKLQEILRNIQSETFQIGPKICETNFESFRNRNVLSSAFWEVFDQNAFHLIYFGDLVTLKHNVSKFRDKNLTTEDVLALKQRMFRSVSKRNSSLRDIPRVRNSWDIFTQAELRSMAPAFDERLISSFRHITADAESLFRAFSEFRQSLGSDRLELECFVWCVDNEFDSMESLKRIQSALRQSLSNCESLSDKERVLKKYFTLFEVTSDKMDAESLRQSSEYFSHLSLLRESNRKLNAQTALEKKTHLPSKHSNSDLFRDVSYDNLVAFYSQMLSEPLHSDQTPAQSEITRNLNRLIAHLQSNFQSRMFFPQDLTHLFCLFRFFEIFPEDLTLQQSVSLEQLRSFVDYYAAQQSDIQNVFREMDRLKIFEAKLTELFQTELADKTRASRLVSVIRLKYHLHFTESFLSEFFFVPSALSLGCDSNSRTLLGPIWQRLAQINSEKPRLLPGRPLWDCSESKPHLRIQEARKLCGIHQLSHQNLLTIDSARLASDQVHAENLSKFVLQELLEQKRTQSIAQSVKCIEDLVDECAMGLYCLADHNCKRALMSLLRQSWLAVPLGFGCEKHFFAHFYPLSGLSLTYKTTEGHLKNLNPFLHPSSRISFLSTLNVPTGDPHKLSNALFHGGSDVHKPSPTGTEIMSRTVFASFVTNNQNDHLVRLSELTMIVVGNSCFEQAPKDYANLRCNSKMSIQMSDLVILIRTAGDVRHAQHTYDYVKTQNEAKDPALHTLLVEVVQTTGKVDTSTFDYWHKKVYYTTHVTEVTKQLEALVEFQQLVHGLGQRPSALVSLAEQGFDKGVQIDLQSKQVWPVLEALKQLSESLQRTSYDFKLQDNMHKLYLDKHAEMISMTVQTSIDKKNLYFQAQLSSIRRHQLRYIRDTLDTSPVYELVTFLNGFDSLQKLQFVYLVDLWLVYNPILVKMLGFANSSLRLADLVRELQHVYDVLNYYTRVYAENDKESKSDNYNGIESRLIHPTEHLRLLPRVLADLFLQSYPLELFNGQHSSVPFTWLTGIMQEMKVLTGTSTFDPLVSVVSTVGLQSSGKSTFLNSLFCLDLTVNDDKCTRGSNAIMLPTEQQSSHIPGSPDYVIVIDTEGIGSPESFNLALSKTENLDDARDQKMLLFNLGVSNLCVVNSMREFGSEMGCVLSSLTCALARLDDCRVQPVMTYAFQCVDSDLANTVRLQQNSINTLRKKFNSTSASTGKSFESVMRLHNNQQLFTIPGISNYSRLPEEYTERIREIRDVLLSDSMLFNPASVLSFSSFGHKIRNVNNLLIYQRHIFNANWLYVSQKGTDLRNFERIMQAKIRRIVPARLARLSIAELRVFIADPENHDQVFEMIKAADTRFSELRTHLIADLLRHFGITVLENQSTDDAVIELVSTVDAGELNEAVWDAKGASSQSLREYLGNSQQDLRDKLLRILNAKSAHSLDQFYDLAYRFRYIDSSDTLGEYFAKIKPLVEVTLVHMKIDRQARKNNLDLQKMLGEFNKIWQIHDNKVEANLSLLSGEINSWNSFSSQPITSESSRNGQSKRRTDEPTETVISAGASTQTWKFCDQQWHSVVDSFSRLRNEHHSAVRDQIERFGRSMAKLIDKKALTKTIMSLLIKSDRFSSSQVTEFRRILRIIFGFDSVDDLQRVLMLENHLLYQLSSAFAQQRIEFRWELFRCIDTQLDIDRIIRRSSQTVTESELHTCLSLEPLTALVRLIIEEFPKHTEKAVVRHYYLLAIVYCVSVFKFNFEFAKSRFLENLRVDTGRPQKYSFQLDPLSLHELDAREVLNKVCIGLFEHIRQSALVQVQSQVDRPHPAIRAVVKSRMDAVINPENCIMQIQKELVELSKKVKTPKQCKLFMHKVIYVATHIDRAIRDHANQTLDIRKAAVEAEVRDLIEEAIEVNAKWLENRLRLMHLNQDNFDELAWLFCGDNRKIDYPGLRDSDTRIDGQDDRAEPQNNPLYPSNVRKLVQRVLDFQAFIFDKESERYSDLVDDLFRLVTLNHKSFANFKQTYTNMFRFCGHRCSSCHGVCIQSQHHESGHKYYHIPHILTGQLGSRADLGGDESAGCDHHRSTDNSASDELFWNWVILKYSSVIRDMYGVAPERDILELSAEEKIQIQNMTEDEVIIKL